MARDDAFDAIVLYSPLCSIQPSASLCVSPIWFHTFASKASSLAMKAIAFVIVMLITVIAFHLIATAIDLVAKLPVIGEVNHMLGGIAGLIKGLLLVWLVFAFAAMGAATEAGSVVIDAVYQSEILQWLYENNLILTILLSFL